MEERNIKKTQQIDQHQPNQHSAVQSTTITQRLHSKKSDIHHKLKFILRHQWVSSPISIILMLVCFILFISLVAKLIMLNTPDESTPVAETSERIVDLGVVMESVDEKSLSEAAIAGQTAQIDSGIMVYSPDIARASLAENVKNREPQVIHLQDQNLDMPTHAPQRLYFFTEIKDRKGETLTHIWRYQGKVVARVPIRIGADRWRAYSSKYLQTSKQGDWTVTIQDKQNHVLARANFIWQSDT